MERTQEDDTASRPYVASATAAAATAQPTTKTEQQSGPEPSSSPLDPKELEALAAAVKKKCATAAASTQKPSGDDTGVTVGFKMVCKLMPETAQRLRDGTLHPDEFVTAVKRKLAMNQINAASSMAELPRINRLVLIFAQKAIPKQETRHFKPGELNGFYNDLGFAMKRAAEQVNGNNIGQVLIDTPSLLSKTVKMAFDSTCEARMKWLGGRRFRKRCNLFNAPVEEFENILHQEFYSVESVKGSKESDGLNHQSLATAARSIVHGLDQVKKACWRCGRVLTAPKTCAKCGIARYCGRDCQVKHWKKSHKRTCPTLPAQFAIYEESLHTVDEAHETGELEGLLLSASLDYQTLARAINQNTLCGPAGGLGHASMSVYYANLTRVVRGEFWFYDDAPSYAEYMGVVERLGKSLDDELLFFRGLLDLLCYDYFKRAAEEMGHANVIHCFAEGTPVMMEKEEFGVPMPVERFLEFYNSYYVKCRGPGEKKCVRQSNIARALKYLRESEKDK